MGLLGALQEARVSDPPFHSMAQVEAYADNTAGTLVQLGLQIARVPAGTADHAAAHVGRGTGRLPGTDPCESYTPLVLRMVAVGGGVHSPGHGDAAALDPLLPVEAQSHAAGAGARQGKSTTALSAASERAASAD